MRWYSAERPSPHPVSHCATLPASRPSPPRGGWQLTLPITTLGHMRLPCRGRGEVTASASRGMPVPGTTLKPCRQHHDVPALYGISSDLPRFEHLIARESSTANMLSIQMFAN